MSTSLSTIPLLFLILPLLPTSNADSNTVYDPYYNNGNRPRRTLAGTIIAGIIIGAIALMALICLALALADRRRRSRARTRRPNLPRTETNNISSIVIPVSSLGFGYTRNANEKMSGKKKNFLFGGSGWLSKFGLGNRGDQGSGGVVDSSGRDEQRLYEANAFVYPPRPQNRTDDHRQVATSSQVLVLVPDEPPPVYTEGDREKGGATQHRPTYRTSSRT